MPLMLWSEGLSVGLDTFDREHKELIGILNDLFDAMQAGQGKAVLDDALGRLVEYTAAHFAHEEHTMLLHDFEGYDAHCAEHRHLTRQVLDLQEKSRSGSMTAVTLETLRLLQDWLMNHIL